MREIKVNLYTINELSKEAKEQAIEKERNSDREVLFFFKEDCEIQLKEKFWNDAWVQYSLSHCQGDGLNFKGKLDLEKFLDSVYSVKLPKWKKRALNEYIYSVHTNGNTGHHTYAHKNQIDYYTNYDTNKEYKNIDKLWQNVLTEIEKYYMSICQQLEKQGYDEIEYQNSDEAIIENFEANEIEFLENGSIPRFK